MDNFRAIYCILRYLEKAMDYDEADMDNVSASCLGITENRWVSIMEMLVKEGYVSGIDIKRSVDGECFVTENLPKITLKGLEYLETHPLMLKVLNEKEEESYIDE